MAATTALLLQQSCISREVAEVVWLTLGKAQANWDTACQTFRVNIPLGEVFPNYFHNMTLRLWLCASREICPFMGHLAYCSDDLYNVRSLQHDIWHVVGSWMGFPWWHSGKETAYNVGATEDEGLIPGSERSPGGEYYNSLQYSCLENRTLSKKLLMTQITTMMSSFT